MQDATEKYLDVLPRVSDFLALKDFSASVAVSKAVQQCAINGDLLYVQPAPVSAMSAAHALVRDSGNCVRTTLGALLSVDLHVRASSGIVLRNSLEPALRALSRVVRLRIFLVGPRLDVLVQALLQCGNSWTNLTHLELVVEEGRYTFPCSRDFLPRQCSLVDIKALFARQPWPQLQRVDVSGLWLCPRCVHWSAGIQNHEVRDDALPRSSFRQTWVYPV